MWWYTCRKHVLEWFSSKQVSNQEMRSKFRFSLTPVSKTLDRDDSLVFNKDDQKWVQMTNTLGQQYVLVGSRLI